MKYTEPRHTKHLDLWVDNSADHAPRVFEALKEFGAPWMTRNWTRHSPTLACGTTRLARRLTGLETVSVAIQKMVLARR